MVLLTSTVCVCCVQGTAAVMNVGDEDVMSGFATLLPGAEGDEEGADAGESCSCVWSLYMRLTAAFVAWRCPMLWRVRGVCVRPLVV